MASKSLGTLTLDLVAKTGGFTAGLDKAARESEKRLKQIQKTASTIGKAIGVGLAGAATGLIALTKSAIDNADELGKLSQKVGIAADDLSKLQYAAKLADVDTAALQTGLVKLAKSAVDAADGTGDAAAAFKALGVDVKDSNGQIKSSYDLLLETAQAFSQYEDGAEKTAAAVAIFGKAGADLIPLLNGGAVAIREAGDELERLGGVVTPEAAKQAEAFNDNITRLQTSVTGLGNELSIELLPTLVKLTDRFVEFNKEAKDSEALAAGLEVAIRGFTGVAIIAGNAFQFLADNAAAWAAIVGAILTGNFSGAVEIARARLDDLKTDINDVRHAFDGAAKSADEVAASIKNFKPDLTGIPTLEGLFGGGNKGKLGYSDEKGAEAARRAEAKATKELADAQKELNRELEAQAALVDDFVQDGTSIFGDDLLSGLDLSPLEDQLYRGAEALEFFKHGVVDFENTFTGAFEAYAASVENVSALLGGDLVSALDSAIARTADLAAETILWGEGGTEALKALARSIITDVVSSLIRAGVQMAVNFALQKALSASATAAGVAEAGVLATAWTPAAIAASIATLGSADAVGLAAYTAAQASGQAITNIGGFQEGGFTGMGGRDQVAGVVHGQEGVVSANALRAAADAINDPNFWGSGKGPQVNITAQPGTVVVRQDDGTLLARLAPALLDMVDIDQASRAETQLGRNFRATAGMLGAQARSSR